MGHEAILYGCIEGATWRTGPEYRALQSANICVLQSLPLDDEWPFLVQGMFAVPAAPPYGVYRTQLIHFGATFKDADNECVP